MEVAVKERPVGFSEYEGFHPIGVEEGTVELIATNSAWMDKIASTYAGAHDAADADNVYNDNARIYLGQDYDAFPITRYYVYRGGVIFDISSIPASATITSAVLSLKGRGLTPPSDPFDTVVVSGADLLDTLVVADFGDLLNDITSFGSFASGDFIDEDWNEITLNAAGLAALQAALASGVIRFGLRTSRDIGSNSPTDMEMVVLYGTGSSGDEPKLAVTYQTAGGKLAKLGA